MKRNYYIFNSGRLRRKHNTIYMEIVQNDEKEQEDRIFAAEPIHKPVDDGTPEPSESEDVPPPSERISVKKPIPIEDVEAFYLFGEIDLNTRLLNFLSQKKVPLHNFNYYGYYAGTYYPREYLNSGELLVQQVRHYVNKNRRVKLAKELVNGAAANILRNLKYYQARGRPLDEHIASIEDYQKGIEKVEVVQELMGVEGRIRERYYKTFNSIMDLDEPFEARVKRPPDNKINALISFGNSLMYTTVLGEIYRSQLNPTVSFLHEPGSRRFSLSLDLSEIFKPVIVDRLIFKLVNNNMLQDKHFDKDLNCCYLKEEGRKIFVREYDERLKTTIRHRKLERNVSYRRLIRLECYKLIKHLMRAQTYEAFRAWW